MNFLKSFKNLMLFSEEQFNQKFWANSEVKIFAKEYNLAPTVENITQDKSVLKLLMSFDKNPTLEKYLALNSKAFFNPLMRHVNKPDIKAYLNARQEDVIEQMAKDSVLVFNVIGMYLIQFGSLYFKESHILKGLNKEKNYIYENKKFILNNEDSKSDLILNKMIKDDIHFNTIKLPILNSIVSTEDFKKIYINSHDQFFLPLLNLVKSLQQSKYQEKYFEHVFDIAFKEVDLRKCLQNILTDDVVSVLDNYQKYSDFKKATEEKNKLDVILSSDVEKKPLKPKVKI